MTRQERQISPGLDSPRRDEMKTPDDVSAMVRLKGRLGRQTDRGGTWLLEDHGEALAAVWRLATLCDAVAVKEARRPG